jgi:hypothetical protein
MEKLDEKTYLDQLDRSSAVGSGRRRRLLGLQALLYPIHYASNTNVENGDG